MATPADHPTTTARLRSPVRAKWDPQHRQDTAAGLRQLAEFLLAHPEVRCPYQITVHAITTAGSDEDECVEVDRAAAAMGVRARDDIHYTATVEFRGRVQFTVAHIPDAWRRHHNAISSYEPNIQTAGEEQLR